MAFQTGTRVDPRLMAVDYSPMIRAGESMAASIAGLGKDIGEGIEKYQKNKEITSMSLAQLEALGASNPDAYSALKNAGGDVSKSIANIEKGDYKQRDVLASLGAMQAYVNERSKQEKAERDARMDAATLASIQAKTELAKAQTTAASQSTPESISTKKLASGQAYLDENNLVIKDGMLYKKNSGRFGWGGSLTPVPNPDAYLNIEGIPELVAQSATGSGTVMMQPQDGWSSRKLDAANAANASTEASVSADALQNVAPSNPEGSRAGRLMRGIGGALDTGAQTIIQMGESAIASVPASAEYLFGEGDLSYSDAQQKYEDPMRRARIERQEKPRNQSGYFPY